MHIGFSSTTIGCSTELDRFWRLEPQSLELCGLGPEAWPSARRFIRDAGIPVGLHNPLPHAGWLEHFEITGPEPARRRQAIEHVARTLGAGAEAGAAYVVVHFPTVFTKHNTEADRRLHPREQFEQAVETAALLLSMARSAGITLYLENVGENPYFMRGEHFRRLFEQVDGLRMCLDFGHAHVLPIGEDVYAFTREVAPYVASVHLYDTSPHTYRVGHHCVPSPRHAVADGWMDLPRLLGILSAEATPEYIVFEYTLAEGEDVDPEGLTWARGLVESLPWR